MARPVNDDLTKQWKVGLPATTAGAVEHLLFDRVHGRPLYAARGKLLATLLDMWLDSVAGRPLRNMPTLEEVRNV